MHKENFLKALPPKPEGGYCPVCQYPLRQKSCEVCRENDEKERILVEGYAKSIGGMKAWKEYKKNDFIRTQCNSKALDGASEFDWRRDSIIFTGPRGTGKSHLSAIIKRPLILGGLPIFTVSMPEVLGEIKTHIKEAKVLNDYVKQMVRARILSIEDMGVEKASEFVIEFYYRVIDGRYRDGRSGMIITMNQELEQLEFDWSRFDPHGRVVSRLREMCRGNIYSLKGEKDWREA